MSSFKKCAEVSLKLKNYSSLIFMTENFSAKSFRSKYKQILLMGRVAFVCKLDGTCHEYRAKL